MARFYGRIGYGSSVEIEEGVWESVITERKYFGDVLRNTRRNEPSGETVNGKLSVGNSVSIVADAYANLHFYAMKYVEWQGALWDVSDIEVQSPRLILKLGGVYNGPTASTPPAS